MNRSDAGKIGAEKSRPIQAARHLEFVENYYKSPKFCKECGETISFEKRRNDFCCNSCAAIHSNLKRGKKRRKKIDPHPCCGCGKATTSLKFCTRKCQQKFQYESFVRAWLDGEKTAVTCGGLNTSNYIKRWLREKNNDKCETCGWCEKNSVTGRVPLQLDHKDGNSENNDPSNLRLLCPNCHSLTSTFGGLNRGKGRKSRYKTPPRC